MNIPIIYEDQGTLAVSKPAGIVVFPEGQTKDNTLIDELLKTKPELKTAGKEPRYGVVHRLDKDTSGVLLIAKTTDALIFLQKQFKNRRVEKKYICLVHGIVKEDDGEIETLIARGPNDKRKQKAYTKLGPHPDSAKEAITKYKVLERYSTKGGTASGGGYSLLEINIETGRRHQIRCHFSYLQHPVVGDKLYGFKNSKAPKELTRQFLHAQKITIQLPNGKTEEFISELPEELKNILKNLKKYDV